MKKVFVACFFAILMLLVPVSTVAQTADVSIIKNVSTVNNEPPKFFITNEQLIQLNVFIETSFEGEDLELARTIRDDIINSELEVDIVELADALITYTFQPIPEEELNAVSSIEELNELLEEYWNIVDGELIKGLFQALIDKIIEFIKDRLGWLNDLVIKTYSLIVNGVELVVDIIQPAILALAILAIINQIIAAPTTFAEALRELFQLEYDNFVTLMSDLIDQIDAIAQNLVALIDQIIDLIENPKLQAYLTELQDFVQWLEEKPWEKPILVSGTVILNVIFPLEGATVTCRGQSAITDINGRFDFLVNPSPSEDSFPPNEYYGMHNCQITVEKDGMVLKQTPSSLSYVFSGGTIEWTFRIIKARSKITDFRTVLMEKFYNFMVWMQNLFPNFFRQINRVNALAI